MARMTSFASDEPDPPACPLLGLAADRRSHFTFPHPGHRCFASKHPATTDANRQASYCLSVEFPACDRFRAQERAVKKARQGGSPPAPDPERPTSIGTRDVAPVTNAIYYVRYGDSLNKIAARFGLTVGELVTANGLTSYQPPAEGTRLVIPLHPPPATVRRTT